MTTITPTNASQIYIDLHRGGANANAEFIRVADICTDILKMTPEQAVDHWFTVRLLGHPDHHVWMVAKANT